MTNLTMAVDEGILQQARKYAVEHNTSVSAMVRRFLKKVAGKQMTQKELLVKKFKASFERSDLEIGEVNWTRDDLYER